MKYKISFLLFIVLFLVACNNSSEQPYSEPHQTSTNIDASKSEDIHEPQKKMNLTIIHTNPDTSENEEINKTIKFEYELTVAILEEMNVEYSIEAVGNSNDAFTAIERGDADAAYGFNSDKLVNSDLFDYSYSYIYAIINFSSFIYEGHHSFIVKKGNDEVLDIINTGIKKVKENGKYAEIYNKYFDDNLRSIMWCYKNQDVFKFGHN